MLDNEPSLWLRYRCRTNVEIENAPSKDEAFSMVYPVGFEPATFGSASQRSIQLSYGYICGYFRVASKET